MKIKNLLALMLALVSATAFGTTPSPITTLNPAGSLSGWVITSSGPTTPPTWAAVSISTLGGLVAANNLSDLVSASAARTNLGLGTAAIVNTGTSGATIPLLSTANTWTLAQAFTVRPTFNGNTPYDTGNLTIASYLTAATATSTYATIAQATTALAATGGSINGVTFGLTTPAAGKVTTLQVTSTITPSSTAGIVGTTTNDSANAGSIGEYVTNSTAGTSLTTATAANATSISLTAGDWDVSGTVTFVPAGTTAIQTELAGINTTSATFGGIGTLYNTPIAYAAGLGNITPPPTPSVRISIASTATVYLVAQASFTVSTCTVSGLIRARRVR